MIDIPKLHADVERARAEYLARVTDLDNAQGDFRPDPDQWSIAEITEHLAHAEWAGINLIWSAADGVRRGEPVWSGESQNAGLPIETIIERTWQPKEIAPESARPEWGGPLGYWIAAMRGCGGMLAMLPPVLEGLDLGTVVNPHPISGPLDAGQRFEFLRFHLDRHRAQVERVRSAGGF